MGSFLRPAISRSASISSRNGFKQSFEYAGRPHADSYIALDARMNIRKETTYRLRRFLSAFEIRFQPQCASYIGQLHNLSSSGPELAG